MIKNLFFAILFFITITVIEYLATTTSTKLPYVENVWDKAKHTFAFFVLFILSFNGFRIRTNMLMLLLLIYGMQIEIVQYFIPEREFSLFDIFADAVGIMLGFASIQLTDRLTQGRVS